MKNTHYFDRIGRKLSYLVTIGIMAAASLFGAPTVKAQDWTLEPVIRVGYEYDDNASLSSTAAPIDIEGYILEGSVIVGYATERTTFDITPMIRSRNYDEDIFDSDDG